MTEQAEQQPEETGRAVAKAELALDESKGYIVPTTADEAFRMAQAVVTGGLAPNSYNNDPRKVVIGIMAALEAGLPPLFGLRQIAVINGRPTVWGDGAIALVQAKNLIANYKVEQIGTKPNTSDLNKWPDDYGYRVTIKRRGQDGEYVGEFTVGHAKRAKLWMNGSKAPWLQYPDRMLLNRARAFPLRDGFADALGGIAIREEIEDTMAAEDKHVAINLSEPPLVEAPPMPGEEEAKPKVAEDL